uniref:SOWAHA-C winged helix-turn-helix domain-containing protein n=1 Tax=Oncorhynchus tshawytscha TaxID=74940 RepID=A0A8C8BXP2_ONCTS
MATECTQEAVVEFLTERGGRVKNQIFIDYFKAVFPEDPDQKAIVREKFKGYVDNVAFVKLENGVKCVCLKKKYRVSLKLSSAGHVHSCEITANEEAQDISLGSGYGTDNATRARPPDISGIILEGKIVERAASTRSVVQNNSLSDNMGNALGIGGNAENSDSASVVSSTTDEDGASVTLDPLEHEWMMCAPDGQWESLHRLLSSEPNLVMKKDFVTGFTCLHWAAKQGKQELLALLVNFAKQHTVPININARSSAGYTPLHLAAMHNQVEVVKLLVGAYDADVEARDYNGKRACQYLTNSVAVDIRDIIGAGVGGDSDSENTDYGDGGRWRLSKVLQSNLTPLKLHTHSEEDTGDGVDQARQKPLLRKSSFSKMRPKLQKIRFRSSQIVHSTSFPAHCETEELNRSRKSSFKSRPMSNLFG